MGRVSGLLFSNVNKDVVLWSALGVAISVYALYVEYKKAVDQNYRAACDINDKMSCSKVLTSKYGRGLGIFAESSWLSIPNPIYGVLYYIIQMLFATVVRHWLVNGLSLVISVVSLLSSAYLAYILYSILHDFCVVCVSTYVVNLLIFLDVYWRYAR